VQKNLTLVLDEDLLRAARKAALDRNTSVNQLVRTYLEQLVRETDRRQADLHERS
jgi:predicted HicB family RNase H-like nuclease